MSETEGGGQKAAAGNLKTILECLALVLTIAVTVAGFWSTRGGGEPASSDATAPEPVAKASRPRPSVRATNVSASGPSRAAVSPAVVGEALSEAAGDAERAERLRQVLAAYPANALAAEVVGFDYDAAARAVRVRVAVSLDAVGHAAITDAVAAALGEPAAAFPVTVEGLKKTAFLQLGAGADAFLKPLKDADRERGEAVAPEALVMVRAAADPPREGQELSAAGWRLTPATAGPLVEAVERGLVASVRVSLDDASGNPVATLTRPLGTPEEGTWDSGRFVQPLVPAGHAWSIAKNRIAPDAAMREWHRTDSAGRSVLALLPGLLSPAERSPEGRLPGGRPLLRTVTYTFALPLSAEAAASVVSASASVVAP